MRTLFKPAIDVACTLTFSIGLLAACGQESSSEQNQPLSAALERPFEACQERFETCRVTPGADPAACQQSMRTCLAGVATSLQQSRALLEQCRVQAAQCRISQPGPQALACDEQFEVCVAPAFQPGASDDDAGTPVPTEEDAGATDAPTGAAGASGSPLPGAAGSAGPGLPPPTPADACRSELLTCLTPPADLAQCAIRARECVRASLLPTF